MVPKDGEAKVYIDFDVRKSIVEVHSSVPPSYKLKPTLRMVEDFGAIIGKVDKDLMVPTCQGGSIYIFFGAGATLDDIDRDEGDPVSSTLVMLDGQSDTGFSYHADFLAPGDYTLAFVCAGGVLQDDLVTVAEPADDPDADDELSFTPATGITVNVVDDGVKQVDILLPMPD